MDGIELAKELKKMEKAPDFTYNLKIVLVSNEEYQDEDKLFDNIFFKPLPISQISEVYNK